MTKAALLPRRHNLDRRAGSLAEAGADGAPDDLLSTREVSDWFGYSVQWLEIGRHRGYGPPFIKVGPRRIRYRRGDVLRWLKARRYACTAEYGQ